MVSARTRIAMVVVGLGLLCGLAVFQSCDVNQPATSAPPIAGPGRDYLFCFWNVENLFDDQAETRPHESDKKYDAWFAGDSAALRLKLTHVADALLQLNNGRGPDILALAEIESERAAELVAQTLNSRIADRTQHYQHVLFKDPAGGRHIATAVLTRLPVRADRTRLLGHRLRILETHVVVEGHDLIVIASHWTSRLTDKTGEHRAKYADQIYGEYRAAFTSNPRVDFLVCGDFNDTPDTPSVLKHLHAIGNVDEVKRSTRDNPLLYNLFNDKDSVHFGTIFYHGLMIFDQIAISPGLLDDQGWTCETGTVQTINTLTRPGDKAHRPWAFGNPGGGHHERGYSDHFPVTVRLRTQR